MSTYLKKKTKRKKDPKTNVLIIVGKKGDKYEYITDSLLHLSIDPLLASTSSLNLGNSSILFASTSNIKGEKPKPSEIIKDKPNPKFIKAKKQYTKKINTMIKNTIPSEFAYMCDNAMKEEEKEKPNPLCVPSSANWFDYEKIHPLEKSFFPEFFNGNFPSKTPNVYKSYRNFIIDLYRENPASYLTATGK